MPQHKVLQTTEVKDFYCTMCDRECMAVGAVSMQKWHSIIMHDQGKSRGKSAQPTQVQTRHGTAVRHAKITYYLFSPPSPRPAMHLRLLPHDNESPKAPPLALCNLGQAALCC